MKIDYGHFYEDKSVSESLAYLDEGITMKDIDDMVYDITHQEEIKESIHCNPLWEIPSNHTFNTPFGVVELLPLNQNL